MGNESSKPPATEPSRKKQEKLVAAPSDAVRKSSDAINSYSPITSRALLLQHLTTWIQCEHDPSKQETAERIEQQWQAEYDTFIKPGSQSHLHPDGLALMVALYFPFNASTNTEYGNLNKNAPVLSNVQNEGISRAQAQWNLDAAEWINSERNGKQKSQDVCKWEKTQQQEFQKWTDPTKDSLLETDQITFLQAIGFPLNADREHNAMNTSSSGRNTISKKRPSKNSTGRMTSKKAKKDSGSSRAQAKAPSATSRKSAYPSSTSWSRTLAMETDKDNLNEYSCFAREQLELIRLTPEAVRHIRKTTSRRNKSNLVAGRVGLRCKHCRQKMLLPGKLSGAIVCTTVSVLIVHLTKECKEVEKTTRKKLIELKSATRGTNGSNQKGAYSVAEYVEKCLRDIGIEEVSERTGLFLRHEVDSK